MSKEWEGKPCKYCGLPATASTTLPRSRSSPFSRSNASRVGERNREGADTARTGCTECNSAIGKRVFPTMAERTAAAKDHIRHKYRSLLRAPTWNESEIQQLGPNMQRYVEQQQRVREVTAQRLRWSCVTTVEPPFRKAEMAHLLLHVVSLASWNRTTHGYLRPRASTPPEPTNDPQAAPTEEEYAGAIKKFCHSCAGYDFAQRR